MRTIYIRHADKNYINGNSEHFKHDPGITEIGVERAKNIAFKLIELYGPPAQIISSPFRRTRETSLIMNSVLKKPLDDISIDVKISEYLGNHNNVRLDVTTHTQIYKPPHPENFEQLKLRVKKHIDKTQKMSRDKNNKTVWFITHGLIIKQIAEIYNIKTSKQLPYLSCFSILEKNDLVRAEFLLFKNIPREDEKEIWKKDEKDIWKRNNDKYKEPPYFRKTIDLFLVPPTSEHTGRDDITGRPKISE